MSQMAVGQTGVESMAPLGEGEWSRIELVGVRLQGVLSDLVSRVPRSKPSALSLSKDLGVDRNITQKVVSATQGGIEGAEVLTRLPGPEALRVFVNAASRAAGLPNRDENAAAAVEVFETLIRDVAGTHKALVQRLRLGRARDVIARDHEDPLLAVRKRIHDAATELLDRGVDTQIIIGIALPTRADLTRVRGVDAHVLLGLHAGEGQPPVTLSSPDAIDDSPTQILSADARERPLADHDGLVKEFCTKPFPRLVQRPVHGMNVRTIDAGDVHPRRGLDLVMAERFEDDSLHDSSPIVWSEQLKVSRPTKRLVIDAYAHRSIAQTCVPIAAAYDWSKGQEFDPAKHWHERMPGKVRLEILGPGLENAGCSAWERQRELTAYLFERSGLNPREFIGYRIDMHYPIWSAMYYLMFDSRAGSA